MIADMDLPRYALKSLWYTKENYLQHWGKLKDGILYMDKYYTSLRRCFVSFVLQNSVNDSGFIGYFFHLFVF